MASPTVAARTEYALTTAGTTITPTFTQTTGDMVIIIIALGGSSSLSGISDGFTDLTVASGRAHIVYKAALDGTEGGNVSITISSAKASAIAWNIQGHAVAAPAISSLASGTSTAPNPATVTPAGGSNDYLWIACFAQSGEEADDDTWCTAAPTSFGNLVQKASGTGGLAITNSQCAGADFASTASSIDPSAFTTAQSLAWAAYTLGIGPPMTNTTDFFQMFD